MANAVDAAYYENSQAPLTRIAEILAGAGGVTASQYIKRIDWQRDFFAQERHVLEQKVMALTEELKERSAEAGLARENTLLREQLRALSVRNKALLLMQKETKHEVRAAPYPCMPHLASSFTAPRRTSGGLSVHACPPLAPSLIQRPAARSEM